jgi:hypothetical protein
LTVTLQGNVSKLLPLLLPLLLPPPLLPLLLLSLH